jgi:inosine-uridine nucleoside N-ribohydrolase
MPQKLIIDADPGIGDALAIAAALLDPDLDLIALTAVGGCVTPELAWRNLQSVVEALDPPKWPRIGVSDSGQRLQEAEVEHADSPVWMQRQRSLNGPDGLGDWKPSVADLHHPKDAAKLMTELARQHPQEIVLLTLGPLTNLAIACDRDAEFLGRLRGVVCLAGAVTAPGNITPAAEFNVLHHPEAARLVLRFPATKTLVPLDVSHRTMLTFEQFHRLNLTDETRCGHLLRQLIPFALRAHHQHLGVEGIWLPELTALASITRPKLFQRTTMAVDVETDGQLTRGMTVFDRRAKPSWRGNIDVLHDVEMQGVLDYLSAIVARATSSR